VQDSPQTLRHVVLVGAGHAHVQVLKRFGEAPAPDIRLTLITREVQTPYSGMLPGLIAGHYSFADAHIDTAPLCRFAGAQLFRGTAIGVDRASRTVLCDNRPPVPYDILSIDTGSTPNTAGVPGAEHHAIPVKPIDGFLRRFDELRQRVLKSGGERRIVVVGGGAGGVELALSVEHRLRGELRAAGCDPARLSLTVITAGDRLLMQFPKAVNRRFDTILRRRRIEAITGARVTRVAPGAVHIEEKGELAADDVLWVTESGAPPWLRTTGFALDERGFLAVDADLRVRGEERVFGAGDVIGFTPRPLPKSGVYAVRAGSVLAENIRCLIERRPLVPFRPQTEALYLISTGDRYAVGTRNGFVIAGRWVWRLKDWIDRRFMQKFKALPNAAAAPDQTSISA
jgi:selenide,water dikinase